LLYANWSLSWTTQIIEYFYCLPWYSYALQNDVGIFCKVLNVNVLNRRKLYLLCWISTIYSFVMYWSTSDKLHVCFDNSYQAIGKYNIVNLNPNSIFSRSSEFLYFQMLLKSFKEQLDLPSDLIKFSNLKGRNVLCICCKIQTHAFILHPNIWLFGNKHWIHLNQVMPKAIWNRRFTNCTM
jgi:hypothetical protein